MPSLIRQPHQVLRLRPEFERVASLVWSGQMPSADWHNRAATVTGTAQRSGKTGIARGFHTTLGVDGGDRVVTAPLADSVKRTYVVRFMERASTGTTSRFFDHNAKRLVGTYASGSYLFQHAFSAGLGDWRWSGAGYGTHTTLVITFDAGSASNDPVVWQDGVRPALTENSAPSGVNVVETSSLHIGNRAGEDRVIDGAIELLVVLNDIPNANTLRALSLSPYAVLLAEDPILLYPMVSGGGASLALADATHGHLADALTLTGGSFLTVADASHGHGADVITLSADLSLVISEAAHGHLADSLTLSSEQSLSLGDASHAHMADNIALSAVLSLVMADAFHDHTSDSLTLDIANTLAVQGASHGHTVDSLTLSAALALIVADALHGHVSDNVTLESGAILSLGDTAHAHTADSPALSAALSLLIGEASHGHAVDSITLTTALSLVIAEALHGHAADNLELTAGGALGIADATHGHTAQSLSLSQALALAIQDALHSHAADGLSLTAELTLAIQHALHAHGADQVVWSGQDVLALLRTASVYLRLSEQRHTLRISDPQVTIRVQ